MRAVILNEDEIRIALYIAKRRGRWNRDDGTRSRKFDGNLSDVEIDRLGAGGELAFSKLHNVYPDLFIRRVTRKNDDGGDVVLRGITVDIKTRPNDRPAFLNVAEWKSHVQAYALMTGPVLTPEMEHARFEFHGFITGADLRQNGNARQNINNDGGSYYSVPAGKLHPWEYYDLTFRGMREGII